MLSTTWTPRALASNAREYTGDLWRVVEAQHAAATMRLVESLADQAVLERTLDESKPPLPEGTEKLHYLLATPFRYRPRLDSRFRASFDAGAWYGAEELRTAMAEKAYWRLRFLLDSPDTPDLPPVPHTAFIGAVRGRAIDLTRAPFARDRTVWMHPTDYQRTQAIAAVGRASGADMIRYESVRDPEHAACVVLLRPSAFTRPSPRQQQTWFLAAARTHVRCLRDGEGWEFTRAQLIP